jgi:hypothetical protein
LLEPLVRVAVVWLVLLTMLAIALLPLRGLAVALLAVARLAIALLALGRILLLLTTGIVRLCLPLATLRRWVSLLVATAVVVVIVIVVVVGVHRGWWGWWCNVRAKSMSKLSCRRSKLIPAKRALAAVYIHSRIVASREGEPLWLCL